MFVISKEQLITITSSPKTSHDRGTIEVVRPVIQSLFDFLTKNKPKRFVIAAGEGVYLCGTAVPFKADVKHTNSIVYAAGINSDNDVDWYEQKRDRFGEGDFGEYIEVIKQFIADKRMSVFGKKVTSETLSIYFR